MKRILALGLGLGLAATALAGFPVSVNPPAPAPSNNSLNQPLPVAVQAVQATLPAAPAPMLSSTPSWPTSSAATPCQGGCTVNLNACSDQSGVSMTRPHFNLLSPAQSLGLGCRRSGCLDRLRDWLTFQQTPGCVRVTAAPYFVPLRTYFPGTASCGEYGCNTGSCGTNSCGTNGTIGIPVRQLTPDCESCRPKVKFLPLTPRSAVGLNCDGGNWGRPGLLKRLLGHFGFGGRMQARGCAAEKGCADLPACATPPTGAIRYANPLCSVSSAPYMSMAGMGTTPTAPPSTSVPVPVPAVKATPVSTNGPRVQNANQPFTNP